MQITHKMHRVRHLVLKEAFFSGSCNVQRQADSALAEVQLQCSAVQCSEAVESIAAVPQQQKIRTCGS